uniref:Beta-1,4-N-acetylgalactosaminyltransferase n=1 Tax=Ascaris suum TaxID=6253 RepID=F1KZB4_ASCSU
MGLQMPFFCHETSLPLFLHGRQRKGRGVCRWRSGSLYCTVCILLIFFTVAVIKNYIDSDYQFLHWHIPFTTVTPQHILCVLVPYRDRAAELQTFAPYIDAFLERQQVEHKIIILNQTDELRFNRASLINVGWYEADRLGCDYLVMHDVDLLPLNSNLSYSYPGIGVVRHISSPQYHPKYSYARFIGGVLMLTLQDYKMVNGMSNKYWGWGLEDDEFYLRLRDANLTDRMERPLNLTTDKRNTFRHIHDARMRPRDRFVIGDQRKMSRRRDRSTGLDSVKYHIAGRNLLRIGGVNGTLVSVLHVELHCDMSWTPYCRLPSSAKTDLK